jgi:hypothetical protein
MKRRAFLRGAGAAGGAVLGARFWRPAEAARPSVLARLLDRLQQAKIAVAARLTPSGGAEAALAELILGHAVSARRDLAAGTLTLRAAPVAESHDAVDLFATFRARSAPAGSISLALDLDAWAPDDYVMLPGACYAGNRFESRFVGYPPLLTEPADIGPHVPPIVTDIPRLNLHPGTSRLEIAAADLATPAVAVFLTTAKLGLIMLVDPATSAGRTGLSVVERDERTGASIAVRTPFVRQERRAEGAPRQRDRPAAPKPGQSVTLRARLFIFDCAEIAELTERLFAVRKQLTGPTARPHTLPFSAAFAAHEARVNARFGAKQGFFTLGARDSAYTIWQTGWCGGFGQTLPLLAAGDKRSRTRARQTIDFVVEGGQAASGFFHGVSDGKTWYDDGFAAPLPPAPADAWPRRATPYSHPRWHLVRRSADALFGLVKQLALLERQAAAAPRDEPLPPVDPTWAKSARLGADALARLWQRHRQFGQFVDVDSGELIVGGSSSAAMAPAALAHAAAYFKEPRYLEIAEESALHYFERFIQIGLTCGGPGDALQCPDSESAAALLESFVTLYEATRDRVWVARARAAAHLLATWVISYDAPPAGRGCPPPGTLRATGAVFTDAQNRVGAPGYVLSSGAALFRLYRATGDVALLELLRDTVHNLAQYLRPGEGPEAAPGGVARRDSRDSDSAGSGDDCSRAETSDWLEAASCVVPADGLFDAIALSAYTEVPGVYAQIDAGFVFAFDHVDAHMKERLAGRLVVALRNPTATEATVRLYAESAADAARPLHADAVLTAPTAVVPPGGTVEVAMPPMTARR